MNGNINGNLYFCSFILSALPAPLYPILASSQALHSVPRHHIEELTLNVKCKNK